MDCYNVQHDGGIAVKIVEDTIGDDGRTEVFDFGDFGVVQLYLTRWLFHGIGLNLTRRLIYKMCYEAEILSFLNVADQLDH